MCTGNIYKDADNQAPHAGGMAQQLQYYSWLSIPMLRVLLRGEGAGWRSVRSAAESLRRLLPKQYQVCTLTAAELLDGAWTEQAVLLVMPGGADLPYCKHLNGLGNDLIKGYVQAGGSYLGLCAGAYYAASRVEFEPGSPLEVMGERQLALFPGIARGAAFRGFDYQTEAGAVAAQLQFAVPPALAAEAAGPQLQQLNGSIHVCSSSSQEPWCHTYDYCNGGPFFVTREGQVDLAELSGVQVLARYCALHDSHDHHQQQQQQQCQYLRNDSVTHSSDKQQCEQRQMQQQQQHLRAAPEQLATRHGQLLQPAAAVRCAVGAGVAVLCGTHPELEPHWLDVCGWSKERPWPGNNSSMADAATPAEAVAAVPSGESRPIVSAVYAAAGADSSAGGSSAALALLEEAETGRHARQEQQEQQLGVVAVAQCLDAVTSNAVGMCEDAQLAVHTQAVQRTLQGCQQQRDLFLSCLLYEVLRRS